MVWGLGVGLKCVHTHNIIPSCVSMIPLQTSRLGWMRDSGLKMILLNHELFFMGLSPQCSWNKSSGMNRWHYLVAATNSSPHESFCLFLQQHNYSTNELALPLYRLCGPHSLKASVVNFISLRSVCVLTYLVKGWINSVSSWVLVSRSEPNMWGGN